jgi:hypothetical protein
MKYTFYIQSNDTSNGYHWFCLNDTFKSIKIINQNHFETKEDAKENITQFAKINNFDFTIE